MIDDVINRMLERRAYEAQQEKRRQALIERGDAALKVIADKMREANLTELRFQLFRLNRSESYVLRLWDNWSQAALLLENNSGQETIREERRAEILIKLAGEEV